jgi:hypothetical protein
MAESTAEAAALSTAPAIPPEEGYVVEKTRLEVSWNHTTRRVTDLALTETVTAPALALGSVAY